MVRIKLENPITQKEIDKMIQQVLKVSKPNILMIDYGDHNFESMEIMRYCRLELNRIESTLTRFSKIAFLSVPPYKSESKYHNKLGYFHSEIEANEWLLIQT